MNQKEYAPGMSFSVRFYRFAAVCSFISVLTTLLLIFLPEWFAPVETLEDRMGRMNEPAYRLRSWVYLFHPFVTWTAALGVALRLRRSAPALALPGLAAFSLWAITEAGQQALTLMVFDDWRAAYLAGDEAVRANIAVLAQVYDGLWDGMYFLLLLGFLAGCTLYGAALWRGRRFNRVLSCFYFAAAALTISYLVSELNGPELPDAIGFWLYPSIQPLGRTLIGVWLWKHANEQAGDPVDFRPAVR
jgi:hypothetical protein